MPLHPAAGAPAEVLVVHWHADMREPERRTFEDRVTALVNATRARRGLPALGTDDRLRCSSRRHCADMAAHRLLAHQLPRCPTPFERMAAEGFPHPAGENVAFGQETPVRVVEAWMRSRPHRANILDPRFRVVGVGVVRTADGHWWTQNFGY
ncbi:CAP domain-containing protein [Lentzea sp. CA-135723]|uniref:CAP domain-containing protein n=1 Tax=Lentzea sp. CA-135723 TaxID=3239950 RepID=UPI003D93E539